MNYLINGYETVKLNENEIRDIADGINLVIQRVEESYTFEDKEKVLEYYRNLEEKIAKVAGWQ